MFDAIVEPFARVHRVNIVEIQVSGKIVGQRKGVVNGECLKENDETSQRLRSSVLPNLPSALEMLKRVLAVVIA